MLMRCLFFMLIMFVPLQTCAMEQDDSVAIKADTAILVQPEQPKKQLSLIRRIVRGFSKIDKNYIEPQHYNWALMIQSTSTYDIYRLSSNTGQSITLSPDITTKIGPYFGWRWIFLGYTFDIKNIGFGSNGKKEFDFSIYSSQIGLDLFYRRTGSDYKIRRASFGEDVDVSKLNGVPFDGVNVGITGFNMYYIFNHNRFSYPAAFAQSTCQKISQGSWMAGIGYTRNSINLNYDKLSKTVSENTIPSVVPDSGLMFRKVKYYDFNVSVGYAYNWVFAKNMLFSSSLSLALAYKRTDGEVHNTSNILDFDISNVNIDGIGRFGIVYNNTKWFAGASAIIRSYTYRKERFAANNIFGSLNIYVGFNFGDR